MKPLITNQYFKKFLRVCLCTFMQYLTSESFYYYLIPYEVKRDRR